MTKKAATNGIKKDTKAVEVAKAKAKTESKPKTK